MIHLFLALLVLFSIYQVAKKFYFPTEIAEHPERYPVKSDVKISKRELSILMTHLQRWRKEGKISREEYDHITDICLAERADSSENPSKE